MNIFKVNDPRVQPGFQVIRLSPDPQSLDEATNRLPGGAYTTLRTYPRRRVLKLGNQLHRLEESARLAHQPVQIDPAVLRALLGRVLDGLPPDQDARLRIILDLQEQPGVLYGLGEVLQPIPAMDYQQGVSVITGRLDRDNPHAKLTNFIHRAAPLRQNLPKDIHECIMVDHHGLLREGLSSNFFAVHAGQLWTAEEGVLPGITRSFVLDEARRAQIPVQLSPVSLIQLPYLSEAFITSASRGILPVKQIDGLPVGIKTPGPVTRLLTARLAARLELELETID